MRVLHVDTSREMRGGQWQVFYLLGALRAAGHECTLLAPAESPLLKLVGLNRLDARPLNLPALYRLSRQAELVHAHDGRGHTLAALVGAPRLVASRRVAFPVGRGRASRWKYSRAGRYVAVSNHVKQTLLEAGITQERISVVYDGVPLLAPSRRSLRVVAPATEDPRKGAALLREAAASAGAEVCFSAKLAEDLRDAGLFVYITEEEGLGSAVLLAMSAAVGVVASRVGGLVEVVEEGRSGLLTDNDPEVIASCIRSMLKDPAMAARFGERGREIVQERFSVDRMVNETLKVYREVLAC